MKQVTVSREGQTVIVRINAATDNDELTPRLARRARNIAFGLGAWATVTDGDKTYRVTKSTRRIG